MTPALDIRGSGRAFFIWHQGQPVGGPYTSNDNAIAALRGVEQRLNPGAARFRTCRCCRRGFLSTGATHCPACRKGGRP